MANEIFLVGNGPSLRRIDMDSLIGKETWAMNRIHLLYPRFRWRPSAWWWCDMPQTESHKLDIWLHAQESYPCNIRKDVWELVTGQWNVNSETPHYVKPTPGVIPPGEYPNVHVWEQCHVHSHLLVDDPDWPTAWHLPTLCKPGTGMSVLMQSAILRGYKRIYLLGCDTGFVPTTGVGDDENHFDADYCQTGQVTEAEAARTNRGYTSAFMLARDYARENGIEIFNATPGGKLEVFPRMDLKEALRGR